MPPDTVRDVTLASLLPRLEIRMLLEFVLDKPRAWLLAHDTDKLASEQVAEFEGLAARRLAGEPMAYLLGWREFMGHRLRVTPATLIPRPETELLVETALAHIADLASPAVLDLGTGSGAIAVSLALAAPGATVTATDFSAPALAVAAENAASLGAPVRFLQGSWYEALPSGARFDLIVSNPPYISSNDPHLGQGDLRFEPRSALTDEAGGLAALEAIISRAREFLKPGGALWVEHCYDQARAVRQLLERAGLQRAGSRLDLAGIERISGAYL
jgi:release factor glutamine methyltransferase